MAQHQFFDNRELSWLKFNERVLEEAQDTAVPLLERLSFISIFQSNLDEFFMVRVGSLYDQMIIDKSARENKTNMTAKQQLSKIFDRVRELEPVRDLTYKKIMSELESVSELKHITFKNATPEELKYLDAYFHQEVRPLVSPLVIDKRHPFPFLNNKQIYTIVHLDSKSSVKIGVVPNVNALKRVIPLSNSGKRFILLEDIILHYADEIFENYKVLDKTLIRITRNADINENEIQFDDDSDGTFRDVMEILVKKRKKLCPIRLQLTDTLNPLAYDYLCKMLELNESQIFYSKAPLDFSFVYAFNDILKDKSLVFNRLVPQISPNVSRKSSMIDQIKQKDLLLSYPFESIKSFIRLLNEASNDDSVVSIKITLYRVAKHSQIIDALINAVENGKDVLVLVELRARFDEENNIGWSKSLEEAGCTVIYGPKNIKVHSKLLLITRKTKDGTEYITQVGTGNYNEKTSTLYTDLSLMTANLEIGLNALNVFNCLSLGHLVDSSKHLLVAPNCLQNKILQMIDDEIAIARSGLPAYIGIKINSLSDKKIILKLAEASQNGVKVDLVIRGICCMVSGVKGLTDNITIHSVVGRYLEHSRIYIFGTHERCKIYISSADYMTRNTVRRVEVAVPIYDTDIKERLWNMFQIVFNDNVKTRVQLPDGTYKKVKPKKDETPLDSQLYLYNQAYENTKLSEDNQAKSQDTTTPPPNNDNSFFNMFLKQN
jgi:polyphosphate kinase